MTQALGAIAVHLALLLGPLGLAAFVLHQLNVLTTRVLAGTFGPWSVVWLTGWLGTPIHELSHAAACLLFRHRILELVLFRPDPATGVVGYVRYSWSPRDPWAVLGHGLVGVAPLFGGALVLTAGLLLLVPELHWLDVQLAAGPEAFTAQLADWAARGRDLAALLLSPAPWTRPETWAFAYLTLCVGTHLAPSGPDLKGAWPSLLLLLALLAVVDLGLVLILGDDGTRWVFAAASLLVPVAAVLALAALLVALALAVVLPVAMVWSAIRGRGLFAPLRQLTWEPWRLLGVVGVGALVAVVVSADL